MIRVNLAGNVKKKAAKAASKPVEPGRLLPLLHIVILAGVAAGGYFWYNNLTTTSVDLDGKISQADAELKQLEQIIKQNQIYEARKAALQSRIRVIDGLRRNQISPVVSLDRLGEAIDRTRFVWLSTLSQNNNIFSLTGVGTSVDAIADFYSNLESTGQFHNINLQRFEDSRGNFTFSMTYEFSPPASRQPAETKPAKGAN